MCLKEIFGDCEIVKDLKLEIDNLNQKISELESIIDDINLGGSL